MSGSSVLLPWAALLRGLCAGRRPLPGGPSALGSAGSLMVDPLQAGLLSFPKAAHPPRTLLRQILLAVPRSCPSLGWALSKQQRTVCRVTEGSQTPSPHGGPAPSSGLTSWIPQASLASAARGSGRSLTTQTPRPSSSSSPFRRALWGWVHSHTTLRALPEDWCELEGGCQGPRPP